MFSKNTLSPRVIATTFGLFSLCTVHAVDVDWDNGSLDGNWNTPANWSTNLVPVLPDDAVFIDPAAGPATISADIPIPRDLRFGSDGRPGTGTVNHSAGTATLGGWFRMGVGGAGSGGTYNLSGGTITSNRYNVGESGGSIGTVNVSGTGVLRQNDVDINAEPTWNRIGQDGNGTFNLSDSGTASFDSRTMLGAAGTGNGTVNQTGAGSLFEVRRGDLTIADTGTGTYNISAGTLRTLNTSGESVVVGQWDNSNGNLNVSGTAQVQVGGDLVVANGNPTNTAPSTGVVTQSSGVVQVGLGGGGNLRIGVDPEANGTYNLSGGTLDLTGGNIVYGAGTHSFNFTGGRLQDVASTNFSLAQQGGVLAPGPSGGSGITTINGGYTMTDGIMEISLFNAGAADQVAVNGSVSLSGTLDLVPDGALALGSMFTIVSNDGTDAIAGFFSNRPDDSTFFEDGNTFMIDYQGGTGNDVVLTVIPEPGSTLLLLSALGLLRYRRRTV